MPKQRTSRKQLFRAALAIANLTAREWAEREGTSDSYLSLVLNEKRVSPSLAPKIDQFIRKHVSRELTAA
jgi:hypothetical protein